MAIADSLMNVLHVSFAGLWTGSVLFVSLAGLPDGGIVWLRHISRVSALVLLLTGGHLAGTRYTVESLTGTTAGWAVLAMLALWVVLAGLVEVATRRYEDGGFEAASTLLRASGVVAALLLIDGGLLASGL